MTDYQDLWLDFQIKRLPYLFTDKPDGARNGQHFFNCLPPDLQDRLVLTPLDTFNWTDERFNSEFDSLIYRIDMFVMAQDKETSEQDANRNN